MKFETYIPADSLKSYVKHFIISENSDERTYKVLPGTSLVMGFQYQGKLVYENNGRDIALTAAGVTGLIGTYRTFKNTSQTGTVLVVFTETGAAHFFKQPLNELYNESVGLDNFFNSQELADTGGKLAEAIDDSSRIKIIEEFLIKHLHTSGVDEMVLRAISYINQSKGSIRMGELARLLNTSPSPLEKRFRKIVGSTPKKFASVVRLKNTMISLQENNYRETVFVAGYYDQAHLIHEFKALTGTTPEQYLTEIISPK